MGKVILSGVSKGMTKPISGIRANTLAVGSTVKLMENGAAAEYLVVHQGLPSSMYDASCDGTWLLRKELYESRQWNSTNSNSYKESTIHNYLNSTFFNLFGEIEQSAIKQVKIPYVNGTGASAVASGSSGLSAQIFLLSGYEVGWTNSDNQYFPVDGAKLDYFVSGKDSTAKAKRIAKLNGSATNWWLRSPYTSGADYAWPVLTNGDYGSLSYCSSSYGIRPALVLPSTALFDKTTLLLKVVA